MTTLSTYPLRLPKTLKAEAEALSRADGTSLNQFVATAVAEKVAVLKTAAFFEERGARARTAAADGKPRALLAALSRTAGEPARAGDELPPGYRPLASAPAGQRAPTAPNRKPSAAARVKPARPLQRAAKKKA